jgi:Ala-tRNA(Pro) deacylase
MSQEPATLLADGSRPATPAELFDRLEGLGIAVRTVSHPPVFTVGEARRYRGYVGGAHTKNLFVRDKKGTMWLVVALEDRVVDLMALAQRLGHRRFSFGCPERLMKYLGVLPGSVTPFAVINDHAGAVGLALDTGLREWAEWNFHPLDNSMTSAIISADMLRFLESVKHAPIWVDLS